jgi:hypothetical protein
VLVVDRCAGFFPTGVFLQTSHAFFVHSSVPS